MEIESNEIQILEDELSGNFCLCGHEISEHYVGIITKTTKCHALINNGAIWKSCECIRLVERQFKIIVKVEYANNQEDRIAA